MLFRLFCALALAPFLSTKIILSVNIIYIWREYILRDTFHIHIKRTDKLRYLLYAKLTEKSGGINRDLLVKFNSKFCSLRWTESSYFPRVINNTKNQELPKLIRYIFKKLFVLPIFVTTISSHVSHNRYSSGKTRSLLDIYSYPLSLPPFRNPGILLEFHPWFPPGTEVAHHRDTSYQQFSASISVGRSRSLVTRARTHNYTFALMTFIAGD